MNAPTKKHPQSILGFFSQFFTDRTRSVARPHGFSNGITEWNFDEFLQEAQPYHVIAERAMLENYLGVRQALPCAAIPQKCADGQTRYWMFQRTDKGGEGKLHGKVACFWGGHVDGLDALFNQKSVLDLATTLTVGRDREQGEEYRIYKNGSPLDKDWSIKIAPQPTNLFIANSTVEVDKYHVAIIYTIDLPEDYAVEVLEEELIGMQPMTAQEALDAHEAGEFELESWALIYFRYVRAQELAEAGRQGTVDDMDKADMVSLIRNTVTDLYRDSGIDPRLTHDPDPKRESGLARFLVEPGELTEEDRAKGYSWPIGAKIEFGAVHPALQDCQFGGTPPSLINTLVTGDPEKEVTRSELRSFFKSFDIDTVPGFSPRPATIEHQPARPYYDDFFKRMQSEFMPLYDERTYNYFVEKHLVKPYHLSELDGRPMFATSALKVNQVIPLVAVSTTEAMLLEDWSLEDQIGKEVSVAALYLKLSVSRDGQPANEVFRLEKKALAWNYNSDAFQGVAHLQQVPVFDLPAKATQYDGSASWILASTFGNDVSGVEFSCHLEGMLNYPAGLVQVSPRSIAVRQVIGNGDDQDPKVFGDRAAGVMQMFQTAEIIGFDICAPRIRVKAK